MKRTPKGREASVRVRVEAAIPDRPMVFTADPRLAERRLIDQPTAGSKSARNLARYYEAEGGPFEFKARAYIQEGGNRVRLFGPNKPWPKGKRPDDGGWQGSVPLDSPRGLLLLKLFDSEAP